MSTNDLLGYIGLERHRSVGGRVLPFAGAFGAGVVIGAGLGILFAPTSGEETRKLVLERAAEINRALRSRFAKDEAEKSNSGSPEYRDRAETTNARA